MPASLTRSVVAQMLKVRTEHLQRCLTRYAAAPQVISRSLSLVRSAMRLAAVVTLQTQLQRDPSSKVPNVAAQQKRAPRKKGGIVR